MSIAQCDPTGEIPCECQFLQETTLNKGFIFNDHEYYEWITLGSITIFFAGVFFYLFQLRNTMAFKARSPALIFIGILLIYLNMVGTTLVFANHDSSDEWNEMCNLNIFV
jgi:hypothetical protein